MTPLAHKMIRQLLLPSKSRFRDITLKEMTGHHDERGAAGLQQRFLEIAQLACVASFFDVTALCGEIGERGGLHSIIQDKMLEAWHADAFDGTLAFLPAPVTWLELNRPVRAANASGAMTAAYVLVDQGYGKATVEVLIRATDNTGRRKDGWSFGTPFPLTLHGVSKTITEHFDDSAIHEVFGIYALLAMVNSPAVFHRVTHMPHQGMARAVKTAKLGELRPWQEIRLSITRDVAASMGESSGIHGQRCLHFVRNFVRFRLGGWSWCMRISVATPKKGSARREPIASRHKKSPPRGGEQRACLTRTVRRSTTIFFTTT